jgi:hypothetical protein
MIGPVQSYAMEEGRKKEPGGRGRQAGRFKGQTADGTDGRRYRRGNNARRRGVVEISAD